MKKKENEVRKKMIVVRMNQTEYEHFEKLLKRTIHRSVSDYARRLLLAKPVTVKFRNRSADAFLQDMLVLKKELNGIGNNFNQAVHKLHLLDRIPEFREWLILNSSLQKNLVNKVEEIRSLMINLYEQLSANKNPDKNIAAEMP